MDSNKVLEAMLAEKDAEIAELRKKIEQNVIIAKNGCEISVKTISPDIAVEYLERNIINRSIAPNVVGRYAKDMKHEGDWGAMTAIAFDKNGNLIDGQHRLSAIIASGASIEFIEVRNMANIKGIDRGRQRRVYDVMCMDGFSHKTANPTTVGAINHVLKLIGYSNLGTLSDSTVEAYVLNHLEEWEIAYSASSIKGGRLKLAKKAAVVGAVYLALRCGIRKDIVEGFCKVVNTGEYENKQMAALALRNYLLETKQTGGFNRLCTESVAEQAIRDYAAGKPISRYKKKDVFVYRDKVREMDREELKNI